MCELKKHLQLFDEGSEVFAASFDPSIFTFELKNVAGEPVRIIFREICNTPDDQDLPLILGHSENYIEGGEYGRSS